MNNKEDIYRNPIEFFQKCLAEKTTLELMPWQKHVLRHMPILPGGIKLTYTCRSDKFLTGHFGPRIGWIRVFGWGIRWKDTRRYDLMFSERYGFLSHFEIGHWSFGILCPERPWAGERMIEAEGTISVDGKEIGVGKLTAKMPGTIDG